MGHPYDETIIENYIYNNNQYIYCVKKSNT